MKVTALALTATLALSAGLVSAQQKSPPETVSFTEQERAAIIRQGPWPMPWQPDSSNRVSGDAEAARLGFRLFL